MVGRWWLCQRLVDGGCTHFLIRPGSLPTLFWNKVLRASRFWITMCRTVTELHIVVSEGILLTISPNSPCALWLYKHLHVSFLLATFSGMSPLCCPHWPFVKAFLEHPIERSSGSFVMTLPSIDCIFYLVPGPRSFILRIWYMVSSHLTLLGFITDFLHLNSHLHQLFLAAHWSLCESMLSS